LALEEWKRESFPQAWALVQHNLGNLLLDLGQREARSDRLEEAVVAFSLALEERTQQYGPLDWATTTAMLGKAQRLIADRTGDVLLATAALENLREAERHLRVIGHVFAAERAVAEIFAAEALVARLSS
jgi:hypothetical protein